jgi:hypothetical protein
MLENFWFNNNIFSNFELEYINNCSTLDEMNTDIFNQLITTREILSSNEPNIYIYPSPIKSIKLIVSHSNTITPHGPHKYIISNVQTGNNTIKINHANIISAFNNSPTGYAFDINLQTIYESSGNTTEIVINNFSQYIK